MKKQGFFSQTQSISQSYNPYSIIICILYFLVTEVNTQCCLKFQGDNCVSCPLNTHLYRGSCLQNKANCVQYVGGFDCLTCRVGFILDQTTKTCVPGDPGQLAIPTDGFLEVPFDQYSSTFTQNILNWIGSNFRSLSNLNVIKIYSRNTKQNIPESVPIPTEEQFYRAIFSTDTGFLQTVVLYSPISSNSNLNSTSNLTILKQQIYNKDNAQQFADLSSDPNSALLQTMLQLNYPELSNYLLLDAFRSLGTSIISSQIIPVINYRVFLLDANLGVKQVNITIDTNSSSQSSQILDISTINDQLRKLITNISNSPNFNSNFDGAILTRLTKLTKNEIQTYTATYQHPQTRNTSAISYFVFDIDTSLGRVIVRDSFLYKIQRNNPTNTTRTNNTMSDNPPANPTQPQPPVLIDNTTVKTNNTNIKIPSNPFPNLKQIGTDLIFTEYIDIIQFIKNNAFDSIRQFLQLYYSQQFIGSDIIQASFAQNSTLILFDLTFRIFSQNQLNEYFTFSLSKQTNTLELIRYFSVPKNSRQMTVVNDSNRNNVISKLDQTTKDIITIYILNSPRYNQNAKLFNMLVLRFNETQPNQRVNTLVTIYELKYYFPSDLNKTYEYIIFRAQILDNNSSRRKQLPIKLYPKQNFALLDPPDQALSQALDFYLQINLFSNQNITYNKTKIWESKDRSGIYRVLLLFNAKYNVIYELDTNSFQTPRQIINESIAIIVNTSTTVNATIQGTTSKKSLEEQMNISKIIKSFPNKTINPVQLSTNATNDSSLHNESQLKTIIADFLKIPLSNIVNAKVLKRETFQKILDTYTVEFATKLSNKTSATILNTIIFQIVNKALKSITNATRPVSIPRTAGSGEYSLKNSTELIKNNSTQLNQTVLISPESGTSKPLEILQAIFDQPFTLLNSIPTLASTTNTTIKKPNLKTAPTTITEAVTTDSTSNTTNAAVQNLIKSLPPIIPLRLTQNISYNLELLPLNTPQKVSIQASSLLETKIATPLIYAKGVATVDTQRNVTSNSKLSLISLQHIYYGNIEVLASLSQQEITDIQYLDNGYLFSTRSISILIQIPQILNVQNTIASQLTNILSKLNYTQYKISKKVTEKDLIYWRFKSLSNINQIDLIYNFNGFIVRSCLLLNKKNSTNEGLITQMEAIGNKNNRLKEENAKRQLMLKIADTPEFKECEKVLWTYFGNNIQNGTICDLKSQRSQINGSLIFIARFFTPSGIVEANMIYNTTEKKVKTVQINNINTTNPSALPIGCKAPSFTSITSNGYGCIECNSGYILNPKDEQCYIVLPNCNLQIAQLCLQCNKGFILTKNYQCR